MSQIEQNLKRLRKKIFQETGEDKVKLVAVTKTRSINEINEAISFGIVSLGENRVQEAEEKFQQIKTPTEKRLVGRLQSNKLKKATALFDTIDSVHSYILAEKISRHCQALKKEQRILLQVNTSKEPSKNGFLESEKKEILKCFSLKGIKIEGLMTVGPHTKNKKEVEEAFRSLRLLFLSVNDSLSKEKQMTELSMGMSDDFLIAIKEGATMVRVGTGIFGRRGLGA